MLSISAHKKECSVNRGAHHAAAHHEKTATG